MKNRLIALMVLLLAVSCLPTKKDKDPQPALAGTYQVSHLVDESPPQPIDIDLPIGGTSAVVIVTGPTDNQISFQIDVTKSGNVIAGQSITTTIRKASGKEYDILDGSTRVGSINGTDFVLDYLDGGYHQAIIAHK